MPIKITETKMRNCCQIADLKRFYGRHLDKNFGSDTKDSMSRSIWFCEHCGQLWHWDRKPGEMDYGYEPLDIKEFLL